MSKSENQKMKLVALKEILEHETDESHGLSMADLIGALQQRYDITAERKSVKSDMDTINEFYEDIEIIGPSVPERKYAMVSRLFDLSELKLMIDAIQASKFLSEAKSRELIKKLKSLCSRHEAAELQRQVIVANRVKSMNARMQYNIDPLYQAIESGFMVSFKYFDYELGRNFEKQRRYMKKGEPYVVSPWAMVYNDDNYYLLAFTDGKFKHFRVDKMDAVKITTIKREGVDEFAAIDKEHYTNYTFNMYGGEVRKVTMVFQNRMLSTVLDRFGHAVMASPVDKSHFQVTVPVAVSEQFYGWVFGLGKSVRIVGPESVKEGMKKALESIRQRYDF